MNVSHLLFTESNKSESTHPIFEGAFEERARNLLATVDPSLSWMESCYGEDVHEVDRQQVVSSEVIGEAQRIVDEELVVVGGEQLAAEAEAFLRRIGHAVVLEASKAVQVIDHNAFRATNAREEVIRALETA